jgi:hypothetical protein
MLNAVGQFRTKRLLIAMLETPPLERSYKGYTISGSADRVFGYGKKWYAAARVTLKQRSRAPLKALRK